MAHITLSQLFDIFREGKYTANISK